MGIFNELWVRDIEKNLFKDNQFVNYAKNHSAYLTGSVVHIPNAGSIPGVTKNETSFPLTAAQRTDTTITYTIDQYNTDMIQITEKEEVFTTYNKRMSVISDHIDTLSDTCGDNILFNWAQNAPAGSIIATTGATGGSLLPGATGARKKITLDDIRAAAALLDGQNISKRGRYMLMDSDLYWELLAEQQIVNANEHGAATQQSGIVKTLYGFNIMTRSATNLYDNGAIVAVGGAGTAATNQRSCFFWQQDTVSIAKSNTKVLTNFGDGGNGTPEYLGGVINASLFFGGRSLRDDDKGIGSIIQAVI